MKPLLYVDGYNVIGVWPQAQRENWPLDVCRDRLIQLLEDYAGYSGQEIWLVFDGYRTGRALRTVEERDGLTVVYTRHGETADHYIERQCEEMPKYREARVATSDNVEQTVILGRGATRISSRELWWELNQTRSRGRDQHRPDPSGGASTIAAAMSREQYELLDEIRRRKE